MPYLNLKTSVKLTEDKAAALLPKLSKALCEPTGKPERYCMASIDNAAMCMAGVVGPAAFIDIRGIGGFSDAVNKKLSDSLCKLVQKELGILPANIYMTMTDVDAANWGTNCGTFG
jgi:phenylpyruvate tautomerase